MFNFWKAKPAQLVGSEAVRTCRHCLNSQEPCWRCWDHDQAVRWARGLFDDNPTVRLVDFSATGLDYSAEIIDVTVLDLTGRVIFQSPVQPQSQISAGVERVCGLSAADLSNAPAWPAVWPEVAALLRPATVVSYGAAFDTRVLRQTLERYRLPAICLRPEQWSCAMLWYAQWLGDWNHQRHGYAWHKLWPDNPPTDGESSRAALNCRVMLHRLELMRDDEWEKLTGRSWEEGELTIFKADATPLLPAAGSRRPVKKRRSPQPTPPEPPPAGTTVSLIKKQAGD